MALKEDCWKNIASVYCLQISEIIQTWNEDDEGPCGSLSCSQNPVV